MNLIEQLGGYAQAKALRALPAATYDCGIRFNREELELSMLEYRREHNMYEVGDKYVMLKLWHDDLMTVEEGEMDEPWWNPRIIRHATDAEIKAMIRGAE